MATGAGPALAGVVISALAFLAALWFLYAVVAARWGDPVARASTLALAFFPTAFFFNAVYAEALFVSLAGAALWALYVRRDLSVAGLFGYFAALTRSVGIFLVIPLAWHWYRHRKEAGLHGVVGVLAPVAGLLTYVVYVDRVTGHPLTFALQQEETWGRTLTSPITTLRRSWDAAGDGLQYLLHPARAFDGPAVNPSFALSNTLNLGFFVLAIVLLAIALVRLSPGLSLYALAAVAAAVLTPASFLPFTALSRYVLAAVPLFFVLGLVLARRGYALAVWLAASAALGAFLTVLFTSWRWVG